MLDMMDRRESMGRRQVVRQLVLVQPFRGSNPFAPVNTTFFKGYVYCADPLICLSFSEGNH